MDGVRRLCTAGGDIVDGVRRLCTAYAVHKGVGRFCRARLGAVARLIKIQTKNKINPRANLRIVPKCSEKRFRESIIYQNLVQNEVPFANTLEHA